MDEIKAKDRTIFSLEKEMEVQTGYSQKLQLQKEALDEQLFLAKEAECNMGMSSPKREVPGSARDNMDHPGSPVNSLHLPILSKIVTLRFWLWLHQLLWAMNNKLGYRWDIFFNQRESQ